MVIPVDAGFARQELLLIEKRPDGTFARTVVLPVRFVPLTGPGVQEGKSVPSNACLPCLEPPPGS